MTMCTGMSKPVAIQQDNNDNFFRTAMLQTMENYTSVRTEDILAEKVSLPCKMDSM